MKTLPHRRLPIGSLALASSLLLTAVLTNSAAAADPAKAAPGEPVVIVFPGWMTRMFVPKRWAKFRR